jgi:hypothetical protein
MDSLVEISYREIANDIGVDPRSIERGKKYILLNKNGQDFTSLGKCKSNILTDGAQGNDFQNKIEIRFENGHKIQDAFYMGNKPKKVLIFEDYDDNLDFNEYYHKHIVKGGKKSKKSKSRAKKHKKQKKNTLRKRL